MRPNLDDPGERAAYKSELRRLGRPWRVLGLVLVAGGVGAWLLGLYSEPERPRLEKAGWAAIAAGWFIFLCVILYRSRYHRARMAGGQG